MQYLVLLYDDMTADNAVPGTPEWDAELEAYAAFGDLAGPAILGGEALDVSAVRTVRHDGDDVTVSDGPFAEIAEGLGGFYVLEAPDLDSVIDLARHIPAAATPSGAIEIRPMVMQMPGADAPPPSEGASRHLATIHGSPDTAALPDTPEWEEASAAHGRFAQEHGGSILGGAAVHPGTVATTIRVRDGDLLVSDGPFLEAIEVVGGYYILHGSPEGVALAARAIPVPEGGAVQLSGIVELGEGVTPPGRAGTGGDDAVARVAEAFRTESGPAVATVARLTGDVGLAEDAVQEAFAAALRRWPLDGVPARPGAWITTTARNRALDVLRREAGRSGREEAATRAPR